MIRRLKKLRVTILITASVIALAGCGFDGGSNDVDSLDGTQWRLTEWTVSSLDPADFVITLAFADGRISGHAGVNSYSATYEAGPGEAFSVGQIAATKIGGPEPATRAESAYLTLLGQARSFTVADARLTLFDAGGNESLLFETATR